MFAPPLALGLVLGLLISGWIFGGWPLLGRKRGIEVPPDRLAAHIRTLSEKLSPRDEEHPENLDRAAAYIRQQLEQAGAKVTEQPFEVDGTTYRNVIAQLGTETEERIVVGAHYDAAGPFPGADDNASGVAGLIELGYLLGQSSPPLRVELVAFALEEPPHFGSSSMGSAVHAASLKRQGVPVRMMVCLEMIGYFSDEPGSQRFPAPGLGLLYPSQGNFIAVVGKPGQAGLVRRLRNRMRRATPLPVHSASLPPSVPGVGLSDHRNYWAEGYDAVMITDTAFFRNENYHTARDTPDTLDYPKMAQVVQGLHAALLAEEKPGRRAARKR